MNISWIYHNEIPVFIDEICQSKEMQRLKDVGMNCGCEYTQFPLFKDIGKYSRYQHSLGVGLIVWHFTQDIRQSIAALLHDIATPCFAHTIDFLNGDYEKQESTEDNTEEIICNSKEICAVLDKYNLKPQEVSDYHLFPIADNDSPKLSADRLEYTLGNLVNFGFEDEDTVKKYYDNIVIVKNEEGIDELAFKNKEIAIAFALDSLKCSNVYVAKADRFSMQTLAEIVKKAIEVNALTLKDLYLDETVVISKMQNNPEIKLLWKRFCSYHQILEENENGKVINAKKRYINPLCLKERVSDISSEYKEKMNEFLDLDFKIPVDAI